jgi:hypothetical protein
MTHVHTRTHAQAVDGRFWEVKQREHAAFLAFMRQLDRGMAEAAAAAGAAAEAAARAGQQRGGGGGRGASAAGEQRAQPGRGRRERERERGRGGGQAGGVEGEQGQQGQAEGRVAPPSALPGEVDRVVLYQVCTVGLQTVLLIN